MRCIYIISMLREKYKNNQGNSWKTRISESRNVSTREDRCSSSRRRVVSRRSSSSRHEYMHARSAVPDTRWPQPSVPRVHSTLLSHPVLLYLRAVVPSHCSGSPLGDVTQTKCRVGAERESNRAKQRRPFQGKRSRQNESAGRVLLIFSNI